MAPLPSNIVLVPAQPADYAALHRIANLSFAKDTHSQLKVLVKGKELFPEEDHASWMTSLADNPRVDHIVAKEVLSGDKPGSGVVVGHAMWAKRNYDKPEAALHPHSWGLPPAAPPIPGHRPLTVADLETITNQSMSDWQNYFCPEGVKCRIIIGVCVHPDYQGKGIGGALMRWGTEKCDAEGTYCWVQSSKDALGSYVKAGFEEIGRLVLDLDMFSEGQRQPKELGGPDAEDKGSWGMYAWPYLRRDPVN